MSTTSLLGFLESSNIDEDKAIKLSRYFDLILEENQIQNITRIIEPRAFYEDMIYDSIELSKLGWMDSKIVDLGTGGGVPGVPLLVLNENLSGIFIDSENRKIEFVKKCLSDLNLNNRGTVKWGRIENNFAILNNATVISKAVGSVSKIYSWIRKCSTWNKLILMKGPKWGEEFEEFKKTPYLNEVKTILTHEYLVGDLKKNRKLILIQKK